MKIVDLNILIYAVNSATTHHTIVHAWWENTVNSEEPVGLAWAVVSGFLRLTTNPRIFPRPLSSGAAIERVDTWLRHPNIRIVRETERHWSILRALLRESGCAGNLTTDAHLAALAISYGATLASCDHDFSRFRGLRWENPLRSSAK